jgi:hypothetical protein
MNILSEPMFLFNFLLLYWARLWHLFKWFTIYYSWIYPLHHFYSPAPIPGIVSTGLIFFIYLHVYMIFAPYTPSHTLSSHLPPPTGTIPPRQDLFCHPVWLSGFLWKHYFIPQGTQRPREKRSRTWSLFSHLGGCCEPSLGRICAIQLFPE